jgi:hypothetical protein
MGLLYGRAGRLNTKNGGFRPGQVPGFPLKKLFDFARAPVRRAAGAGLRARIGTFSTTMRYWHKSTFLIGNSLIIKSVLEQSGARRRPPLGWSTLGNGRPGRGRGLVRGRRGGRCVVGRGHASLVTSYWGAYFIVWSAVCFGTLEKVTAFDRCAARGAGRVHARDGRARRAGPQASRAGVSRTLRTLCGSLVY